ncbi:MAG: hypothetical protein ACU836_01060 [Gammaproteobacteria bacterium]
MSKRLFDTGAAVLFFGALAQQPQLHETAKVVLSELAALGYQVPTESQPVRLFPALTSGEFSSHHAGGWRPGVIYLRMNPHGAFDEGVYLRHELFHEASHLSCDGRLPAWAEEAGALHFSGELFPLNGGGWPDDNELQPFRTHIRQGAPLTASDRELLARMVNIADWPDTPCAISPKIQQTLGSAFDDIGNSAYVLMNLQSGRLLESSGDMQNRSPPGSLLKLVFAASLSQANPDVLSEELAASDSEKLLQRRRDFLPSRYRLLLSPITDQRLPETLEVENKDWLAFLGGRSDNGNFPVLPTLPELALAIRGALLSKPEYFMGLTHNGSQPSSTLFDQAEADKNQLRQMQVLAKTGTVSTSEGKPLAGHLLLAWPAPHPVYVAIFRQQGKSGAAILPKAVPLLKKWQKAYPPRYATVRVHLLSLTDRSSWEARNDCPELTAMQQRFTVCGEFHIVSSARGSRSDRVVRGVLYETGDKGPTVLETDMQSYVDGVLAAEAQDLPAGARQALRAVVAWNAAHGRHRHPGSSSLCDTTHCMAFLGEQTSNPASRTEAIDIDLVALLDGLAAESNMGWLPFAAGGDERWQRQISATELGKRFDEKQILDIRRERRKNGGIFIRLYYPDNEESLSCEVFRNTLKLPSCPDSINEIDQESWLFQGLGAGHGLGLSVARAKALALKGRNVRQILEDAYRQ